MKVEDTDERYREAGRASTVVSPNTDIVTGEGVGLVLPAVTLGTRVFSAFIDYSLYTLTAGVAAYYTVRFWQPDNFAQVMTVISVAVVVWAIFMPFIVQYATRGSSLGRLLTRSRTVRYDGGAIGLRHALTRAVAGLFDIHLTIGVLGIFSIMMTPQGQRTGDALAGTIVVRWPKKFKGPEPHEVHPSLQAWAQVATTQTIPGNLSIVARDFLRSTKHMTEETRTTRGRQLAAELEQYVAPPAPRGTHPEAFISTVLAMREAVDYRLESKAMERQFATEGKLATLPYSIH